MRDEASEFRREMKMSIFFALKLNYQPSTSAAPSNEN